MALGEISDEQIEEVESLQEKAEGKNSKNKFKTKINSQQLPIDEDPFDQRGMKKVFRKSAAKACYAGGIFRLAAQMNKEKLETVIAEEKQAVKAGRVASRKTSDDDDDSDDDGSYENDTAESLSEIEKSQRRDEMIESSALAQAQ